MVEMPRMTVPRKKVLAWCAAGAALLLMANAVVAVRHAGAEAGRTYRWVCRESGAELSYTPGVFGSARLAPGRGDPGRGCHWQLVEPRPPSPWLPWNWLAAVLHGAAQDPEAVIRQENLSAG
jgi:hypothetical protein